MYIKRDKLSIHYIDVVYFITLIIQAIAAIKDEPFVVLLSVLSQLTIIIYKSRVSFYSIFIGIVFYVFFMEYVEYTGTTYGLLAMDIVPVYYYELSYCEGVFHTILFYFVYHTNFIKNEIKVYNSGKNLNNTVLIILSAIAIMVVLLVFPSFPQLHRVKGILPFNFHIIPFSVLLPTVKSTQNNKWLYFVYFFVAFWTVGHAERAAIVGFLVAIIVIKYHTYGTTNSAYDRKQEKKIKKTKKRIIRIAVALSIPALLFLTAIAGVRQRGGIAVLSTLDIKKVISALFIQGTCCDVAYVFNCCVDLAKNGNCLGGKTLLTYIIEVIPFSDDPYLADFAIRDYYKTVGGMLFFSEGIMNFGLWFVVPWSFVLIYLNYLIVKKQNNYTFNVWVNILMVVFRLALYGLYYPYVQIIWVVPVVIFIEHMSIKKRINYTEMNQTIKL